MKHTSTTMTVRIDSPTKKRLAKLATTTRRTPSFLAADAIEAYLDLQEWQVGAIQVAIEEADSGELVPHREIASWVRGWKVKKK